MNYLKKKNPDTYSMRKNNSDWHPTPLVKYLMVGYPIMRISRVGVERVVSLKCIPCTGLLTFLVESTNILVHVF